MSRIEPIFSAGTVFDHPTTLKPLFMNPFSKINEFSMGQL
jgi:hypothetical protein